MNPSAKLLTCPGSPVRSDRRRPGSLHPPRCETHPAQTGTLQAEGAAAGDNTHTHALLKTFNQFTSAD